MTTIAFIGVGRMGSRMATRLLEAGHDVRVNDLSEDAAGTLLAAGATWCATPAAAAEGADWVLLSLPNPADVLTAVAGPAGALETASPGAVVIDFSTVGPGAAKEVAAACAAKGVGYLDAPVSGGVRGAAGGTLTMMVGGEAETLERSRPVLDELSGRLVHCGPVGSGQLAKICHNLLAAINTAAAGEVLAAGVRAGGDLGVLMEVMTSGMAGSKMLTHLNRTLFTEERPANFTLELMRKDVMLCLDELAGSPMPVGQTVAQLLNIAQAEGLGKSDSTSVVEVYERWHGLRLSLPDAEQ